MLQVQLQLDGLQKKLEELEKDGKRYICGQCSTKGDGASTNTNMEHKATQILNGLSSAGHI